MVKEEKIEKVENLKKIIEGYKSVGVVEMHKMPSAQLQKIRKELRGDALILMIKKSILKFAFEGIGKNELKKLEDSIGKQPAIILSNIEAFKLYSKLSRLKFPSFAKEGDVALHDITVRAGPTTLMPGPVISEFQRAGIPAGIEEGKIAIKKDKTVVKKGEVISGLVSSVLRKLNIKPMEVSLNVVGLVDGTDFYSKDVLELVNIFPSNLPTAFNNALNVSVSIAYPTKENIKYLLTKAVNVAKAVKNATESKVGVEKTTKAEKPEDKSGDKSD